MRPIVIGATRPRPAPRGARPRCLAARGRAAQRLAQLDDVEAGDPTEHPGMVSHSRVRSFFVGSLLVAVAACGTPTSSVEPATDASASAASPTGSAAPSGSGPTEPAPPLPPPGDVLEPRAAAAAVLGAADDASRVAAILGVLDGVNFGVYTSSGDPIVVGAERSEGDAWAYDFEVAGLAAAVRDGDEITLGSIAADIASMAAAAGDGSITAAGITQAVHDAAASIAADLGQPNAYALAVAIELGRQGPRGVDLAAAPTDDGPVILDGLAAFLVTLDLVLPAIAAQPPSGSVNDGRVASAGGIAQAAAPCPQNITGSGGWIAGISAGNTGLGGATNASFDRYLQGRLVGGTVDTKLGGSPAWHHAHEDANGEVQNEDKVYELIMSVRVPGPAGPPECGALRGATMAPLGAIVGADVSWNHIGLEEHGTVDSDPKTSERGHAQLIVTPRIEPHPAEIGPEQRRGIDIEAKVNVLQALGGDLYTRLAGVPALQLQTVHTEVSWHRSYLVDVELESKLTATRGSTYRGTLGNTTATGTFRVTDYYAATQAPPVEHMAPVSIFSVTTTATSASTKGDCNTEWIAEKGGASRNIDWMVTGLIVYPETDISLAMDAGMNYNEFPDIYDGLHCSGGGKARLGPSPGNVWESLIFLAYQQGIKLRGTGPDKWTILATPDTWARGGEIAKWKSNETCQGYCSGTLEVTIRVRRLPGP
jgi:hypothetical protein